MRFEFKGVHCRRMDSKNYLKHFFIIGGGTVLNLLLSLFTTPLITRLVAPIEYGKFSIFTMYSNMALIILLLGMDQALLRFYYERNNIAYKRALVFKCTGLPAAATVVTSAIVIVVAVSGTVNFEFSPIIMTMLCVYTFIMVVYRFSLNVLRLEYNSKMFSILNIIQKIGYIVFAVPLLYLIKSHYLLILTSATAMSSFICLIISIVYQKDVWNIGKLKTKECKIGLNEILQYSLPLIVSMGITTLFQAIDKMSLNYYRTYKEVGIYSSAISLVNVFAVVQSTFNILWNPMATEHYVKNPDDKSFYQKGNQIITVIMFFMGISLIFLKDIFAVLLGEKYREAAYILPFLIFHPIMYTISETTVTGISFMKKSKMQILIATSACITNIIGNTILVPWYGCQGAAISTGISYIVFFTMRTLISNKYFYVDFKLKKFYFLTVFVTLYALYNTFVRFNVGSVVGYLICLALLVLLYKGTITWELGYLRRLIHIKIGRGE